LTLNAYLYSPHSVQEKIAYGFAIDEGARLAGMKKHLGGLQNVIEKKKPAT
jgi:hypothetical protein